MRYRFAILLLALAAACGEPADRRRITIQFIHAVPDGVAVDIWIEGKTPKLFQDVGFASATSFIGLEPGTYNFQLRTVRAPETAPVIAETGDVVLDERGTKFTVIFGGLTSASALDPDALRLDVYQHEFEEADQSKARIRLVHNAPGEPTFDIAVRDDTYVGLEIYTASDGAGIQIDADFREQLLVEDNGTGALLTAFTTRLLPSDGEFFVVFLGSMQVAPREDAGFRILVADKKGGFEVLRQNPRLYMMNAVADSLTLSNTYALNASYKLLDDDGVPFGFPIPLEQNLLYGDLGGDSGASLLIPPGEYEFTFHVVDDPDPLGSALPGPLLRGEQYMVTIGGRQDGTWPFSALFSAERFDTTFKGTGTEDLWRIVHQAPDVQAVFLGEVINNAFEPLPQYPDSISYTTVDLPPGTDIGIDPFSLAIVRENQIDQFGIWEIVPVPDACRFVVLLGSIDPQLRIDIPGFDNTPQLSFIDTTTQPWTLTEQFPD